VQRTTRFSIWPVLIEIVTLNIVLTLAMLAMPTSDTGMGGPGVAGPGDLVTTPEIRDTMLKILAEHYVGHAFAAVASIIFALLLLSAVNTAITDLVSIQFMMARDKEMPQQFGGLNRWGMPVLPLIIGTLGPIIVVTIAPDVGKLADLYAIGVVGAVALNLGSCATNPKAQLKIYERILMTAISVLMALIWITIAVEKPNALIFATSIMGIGLTGRWVARHREEIRSWAEKTAPALVQATDVASVRLAASAAALIGKSSVKPTGPINMRLMVATRGNPRLMKFAIDEAKAHQGEVLAVFVRHVAVTAFAPVKPLTLAEDAEAVEVFQEFRKNADAAGVPAYFIYSSAFDVAEAILELASTHAVDMLLLGTTQRGVLWRAMKGDIIQQVAAQLPERITLLVHAG
jgi:nucleotide-binding universal stress UspA family protein